MNNFKIGDLVRRTADPVFDYRYMISGEVYTVTGLPKDDYHSIEVNNLPERWDYTRFELYKPEPTELEEAYAKIDTLESALVDVVKRLDNWRNGRNESYGLEDEDGEVKFAGNELQFKPISEMTYEDWLELYNSEDSSVFWDSLGRELTLEYLWKDSDTSFSYAFEEDDAVYNSEGVNQLCRGHIIKRIK